MIKVLKHQWLCRLTCSLMQHGRNNGKKLLAVSHTHLPVLEDPVLQPWGGTDGLYAVHPYSCQQSCV